MNAYSIILILFIVLGLGASAWGGLIISRSRKSLNWPKTQGTIVESETKSSHDDLLPNIGFRYKVDGQEFKNRLAFPADVTPTQEFSQSYTEKYPLNKTVEVYFNPLQPQQSTLEPGLAQGDWLVLAMGLGCTIIGLLLYVYH